jgi:hypothetical protein
MPVKEGKDKLGNWARWGTKGKKYYWNTQIGRTMAIRLAERQGRAIHAQRK